MVTTRSKTSKLGTESVTDNNFQTVANSKVLNQRSRKVKNSNNYNQFIIFISLLLDLIGFTIILPLLPSILEYYKTHDANNGLYSYLDTKITYFQRFVGAPSIHNMVLFGGILGSLFSFLQFLASPIVGAFSDVYGRKPTILLCLVGIAFSYWLWSISSSFLIFIIARFMGGISKGNLSLSMAAMTDISSSDKRASGMALIGSAFSVGFVVGPIIGAYFTQTIPQDNYMWFTKPAIFALCLIGADILFVIILFKETLPKEKRMKSVATSLRQAFVYINVKDLFLFTAIKNVSTKDLKQLRSLGLIYFLYLFLYSGLEFTLTFLTHFKFQYTSMEKGQMLSASGFTMALLQGAFVRRIPAESVQTYASLGLLLTVPAYFCVGTAQSHILLWVGVFLYSVATSFVVPCMTTIASKYGSPSQKGTALGIFRSLGLLARAVGPIVASIAYWSFGSLITYCTGGVLLLIPWYMLKTSPNMKI